MINIINSFLQNEMKKSDFLNDYLEILSINLEKYLDNINDNSNFSYIDELYGRKLELFGARYGVARRTYWRDRTLRKSIRIETHKFDSKLSIIDNFQKLITVPTSYLADIDYLKLSGESGSIHVMIKVPPTEPIDLIKKLDDKYVYGCRVDWDINMDIDFLDKKNIFTTTYTHNNIVSKINNWR